jgi:hypothetical protein
MKDDSKDLGPLALMWTLVGALNDAMNLRNLREELYGEAAQVLPPRVADVEVPVPMPIQQFDQPPLPDRSVRVERLRADFG